MIGRFALVLIGLGLWLPELAFGLEEADIERQACAIADELAEALKAEGSRVGIWTAFTSDQAKINAVLSRGHRLKTDVGRELRPVGFASREEAVRALAELPMTSVNLSFEMMLVGSVFCGTVPTGLGLLFGALFHSQVIMILTPLVGLAGAVGGAVLGQLFWKAFVFLASVDRIKEGLSGRQRYIEVFHKNRSGLFLASFLKRLSQHHIPVPQLPDFYLEAADKGHGMSSRSLASKMAFRNELQLSIMWLQNLSGLALGQSPEKDKLLKDIRLLRRQLRWWRPPFRSIRQMKKTAQQMLEAAEDASKLLHLVNARYAREVLHGGRMFQAHEPPDPSIAALQKEFAARVHEVASMPPPLNLDDGCGKSLQALDTSTHARVMSRISHTP